MTPSWAKRTEKSNGLPNLGLGGTLVTAIVTSYFAAKAAGVFLVILVYGWHPFFAESLHLKDWKHGVLSNGEPLPCVGLTTFVFWMLCIGLIEWIAGFVPAILLRCGPWAVPAARLVGGALLVSLAFWFYICIGTFPLIHPVPFSALISGIVLVWKGLAGAFQSRQSKNDF